MGKLQASSFYELLGGYHAQRINWSIKTAKSRVP
jgi:hypothetical protein